MLTSDTQAIRYNGDHGAPTHEESPRGVLHTEQARCPGLLPLWEKR